MSEQWNADIQSLYPLFSNDNHQMSSSIPLVYSSLTNGNQEILKFMAGYTTILKTHLKENVESQTTQEEKLDFDAVKLQLFNLTGGMIVDESNNAKLLDWNNDLRTVTENYFSKGNKRTCTGRIKQDLKAESQEDLTLETETTMEKILTKQRLGKLPADTRFMLKNWWEQHSQWPYPTEEDKSMLVQKTGLRPNQINNWFKNQRKRYWHGSPILEHVLSPQVEGNDGLVLTHQPSPLTKAGSQSNMSEESDLFKN